MQKVSRNKRHVQTIRSGRERRCSSMAGVWVADQKSILVCVGYRQWRLLGQKDNISASTGEQLSRWLAFLDMWEIALAENKEVIVTMDANLDFLSWRDQDLPPQHSSSRLKPLIDALFDQIFLWEYLSW